MTVLLSLFVPMVLQAQDLSLQTDLDVRVTRAQSTDGQTGTAVHFEPHYQLSWRGPIQGGTNIYADFDADGGLISDPGALGLEQEYQLNLHSQGEALNLNATLSRSSETFRALQSDGTRYSVTSRTDTLSVNGILAYPAYPLLSFQHQVTRSSTGSVGTMESAGTLLDGNYDWGPVRLSLDQQWQSGGGVGQSLQTTQYGVNFDTWLTPMAQLTAYHYGYFSRIGGVDGLRSSNFTTTVRMSAVPTPFLVMDGEMTDTSSSQTGVTGVTDSSSLSHSLVLRSDPLPGVRLDASERGETGQSGAWRSRTQAYTAQLGLTPAPNTQLLALVSNSSFSTSGDFATSKQQQDQLSFAMPLCGTMDLNATYNRSLNNEMDSGYRDSALSVGLTGDLGESVRTTATYRVDGQRSWSHGVGERQDSQSVQLQANWLPSPDWDLTLGVDAVRSKGTDTTTTVAPIVETRWNMSPLTMLTLRYNLQHINEDTSVPGQPFTAFAGTSSFLDVRLTQQLSDTESVELTYDDQRLVAVQSQSQQMLELRWLKLW